MIHLQKNDPLILSSLWSWLEHEIFFTLIGKWIEQPSQQIFCFELVKDLLFFKNFEDSLNLKDFGLKFFGALEDFDPLKFNDLEPFEIYGGSLNQAQLNFFECFSGVLEVEFLKNFGVLKSFWRMRVRCYLFIVVSRDKSHFGLIFLKISSRLWFAQILVIDNYLYLSSVKYSILMKIIINKEYYYNLLLVDNYLYFIYLF